MTVSLIDYPFVPHMNTLYVLLCKQNSTRGLKGLVGGWGWEGKGKLQSTNSYTVQLKILTFLPLHRFRSIFVSYHLEASVQPRHSNFCRKQTFFSPKKPF